MSTNYCPFSRKTRRIQLVENNSSQATRRKLKGAKLVEKQLAENKKRKAGRKQNITYLVEAE